MNSKLQQSFNARYMSFEQVAKSFVMSEHFENIIRTEHTVITGSRGCGKTTLLKMLHPKALFAWNAPESKEIKNRIDFTGIYIPSDRQWGHQFSTFEKAYSDKKFVQDVLRGVINSNVLIAVCSTFNALIENSNVEPGFEIELSLKLIENWEISTPISPHLDDITIKIRKMISDFNAYYRQGIVAETLPKMCYKTYTDLVSIAIDCFNSLNRQGKYKNIIYKDKWALCFDELEIMPKSFREEIVNSNIRGIPDQRLILKLTSTPGLKMPLAHGWISPSEVDDYTVLKLWVYDERSQEKWRNYCDKYMKFVFEEYYNNRTININTLFGKSLNYNKGLRHLESAVFAKSKSDGDDGDNQFSEQGIMYKVMLLLQEYDASFYHYLIKKGIDPLNPIPNSKLQEAAVHRKIKPIVLYRYYFMEASKNGSAIKARSRKVNAFNNGKEFIFDIADGNPRAFAYLVNEFINKIQFTNNCVKEISVSMQSRIIFSFSKNHFYKKITNYPTRAIKINNQHEELQLHEIINKIGNYFFKKMIVEDFNPDPVIFFYVTPDDTSLSDFIEVALEAGAIFKVEKELNVKSGGKKRDVYRLSYSLYPIYKLPKVDYNPIPLTKILCSDAKTATELTLFSNLEIE